MDSEILKELQASQNAKTEKDKIRIAELNEAYRKTFCTVHGKKVLVNLFDITNMFATTFTGNSQGMYLEGMRKVGLYLLGQVMAADREIYIDIIRKMGTEEQYRK